MPTASGALPGKFETLRSVLFQPSHVVQVGDYRFMPLVCTALLALQTLGVPVAWADSPNPARGVAPTEQWTWDGEPSEVRRSIAGGEVHLMHLELTADQCVDVRVEQGGIDLKLEWLDPSGTPVWKGDSPFGNRVAESFVFVAPQAGRYGLRLSPFAAQAPSTEYVLSAVVTGPASERQRQLAWAHERHGEAYRQYRQRTADSFRSSIEGFAVAAELWEDLDLPHRAAESLYRRAVMLRLLGKSEDAEVAQQDVLGRQREIGFVRGEAASLNQLGLIYRARGDFRRAAEAYGQALDCWRRLRDAEGEGKTASNLAVVLHEEGRFEEALAMHEQSLVQLQATGNLRLQVKALYSIGGLHDWMGNSELALSHYQQALQLAESEGDGELQAATRINLAVIRQRQGRLRQAEEDLQTAIDLLGDHGDQRRRRDALINLAALYLRLNRPSDASIYLRQALEMMPENRDRPIRATALTLLGKSHQMLGQAELARAMFEKSLVLRQEQGDQIGEIHSRLGLARVALGEGDSAAAETVLQAMDLSGFEGTALELTARLQQAEAAWGLERWDASRQGYARARDLGRELGWRPDEALALYGLAQIDRVEGDLQTAAERAWQAMEMSESVLVDTLGERHRSAFLALRRPMYELAVATAVDAALDPAQPVAEDGSSSQEIWLRRAFEASERAHARGLEHALQDAALRPSPEHEEELERLRWRLRELHEQQEQGDDVAVDLQRLEDQYRSLKRQRWGAGQDSESLFEPPAVGLDAVQRHYLDQDTVLLEYILSAERSFVWWVGSDTFSVFELPPRDQIESLARRAYALLRRPDPSEGAQQRAVLTELGRVLLGPVAHLLQQQRLVIVADGALHRLPFAALQDPRHGEPVMQRHATVHLPSMAVLEQLRKRRGQQASPEGLLAALADPVYAASDERLETQGALPEASDVELERLPASEAEARAALEVATQLGSADAVYLGVGFDSSRQAVLDGQLESYGIVHLATHGLVDDRYPERSGLMLSTRNPSGEVVDGLLSLQDIYGLRLSAELVVLSGCETALGQEVQGEGLLSLTRGFFYAGSSQVLASLWSVRDRATAQLMSTFYRHLLIDGDDAPEALRRAQVSMWQQRSSRDPYFWAPFVLEGDWQGGAF